MKQKVHIAGIFAFLVSGLLLQGIAQAAPGSDLTVTGTGTLTPLARSGSATKIVVQVVNKGRTAAGQSHVRFLLSTDASLSKKDKQLGSGSKLTSLRGRAATSVSTTLRLPRLAPRPYFIFACVDDTRMVAETNERNNCSVRGAPISVQAARKPFKIVATDLAPTSLGSKTISTKGGTVQAFTANATYALIVPAGALARDTLITIKPLASVGGLPFAAGMTAGVRFEPEGLQFALPATLVIAGPGLVPRADDAVFSFHGSGSGFHLQPGFRTTPTVIDGADPATTIYIPVLHFSGVGIAPATDRETAMQYRRDAATASDQLAQQFNRDTRANKDTSATMEAYVDQVLIPEAAAGVYSDAMYEAALADFVSWQRLRLMWKLKDSDMSKSLRAKVAYLNKLLDEAWAQVIIRAEKRCRAGDFTVIARILALERARQLGLQAIGRDAESDSEEFAKVTQRCWRFELKVTSRLVRKTSGGFGGFEGTEDMAWTLTSRVPLKVEGDTPIAIAAGRLVGASPLIYSERRYAGTGTVDLGEVLGKNDCAMSFAGATRAGALTVHDGAILAGPRGPLDPTITIELGDPGESIRTVCRGQVFFGIGDINTDETEWKSHFIQWWRGAHAHQSVAGVAGYDADDGPWTLQLKPSRHPIVGKLTTNQVWADQGATLTESWELIHTPLRPATS